MNFVDEPTSKQLIAVKQAILTRKGYYNLRIDGIAGGATLDAVTRCKSVHGLMARPFIGQLTDSLISHSNEKNIVHWDDVPVPDPEPTTISGDNPAMLAEAMKHIGVREWSGRNRFNPEIKKWADELKAADVLSWYPDDDIPWCGLFIAILALRCHPELTMPPNVLSARNWGGRDVPHGVNKNAADEPGWGKAGPSPQDGQSVYNGSVGIMWRTHKTKSWHGHIGVIFAQNDTHIGMVGGNQSNSVSLQWYPRSSFLGTRVVPGVVYHPAPKLATGTTGGSVT